LWSIFPFAIFILFFGPVPEEIGWRGYGLDSLALKFGGLIASLILGFVWGLWHVPLFLIEGYPLAGYTDEPLRLISFFLYLFPKSILYTYVYYMNNRSILSAILLHFTVNLVGQIIEIDLFTEYVAILLFTILAIWLASTWKNIVPGYEIREVISDRRP
jgi:uncharacterized protein